MKTRPMRIALIFAAISAASPVAQAATIQTTCGPIVLSCKWVAPNPSGIWVYHYSDRERECAAALHSANRAADEGAGPKIPSHQLACY